MTNEPRATPDELKELREELRALREEIKGLKEAKKEEAKKEKDDDKDRITDAMTSVTDEFSNLSRGFFFAGLESFAQMADLTRTLIDKTSSENEKRKKGNERLWYLPIDMTEGFIEALDDSTKSVEKIVDKFNEKYKEK
ncbi:hypothetical protein HYR99_09465 [Candidatus Poribacteria bacterium]|nr:hypothetical protein [Candidatus Poribacteria bacterium]